MMVLQADGTVRERMPRVVRIAFGLAAALACNDEVTRPQMVSAGAMATDALATVDSDRDSDRAALVALYRATNGPEWTRSDNWLTDAPLGEWHGVEIGSSTQPTSDRVSELFLSNNNLAGRIPPELGKLHGLLDLRLYGNAELSGALPDSLANLVRLKEFNVGGTDLCARPDDFAVQLWLSSMRTSYVPSCRKSAAYVVQAVQSATVPVPLVAGRPGLLRVFVTAPDAGGARVPSGWATFYQVDGTRDRVRVLSGNGAIPPEIKIAEGSLSLSANAEVPGEVLRPGVEMVVVLDPSDELEALGVPQRIPETGRAALVVYEMPSFDVTVVPLLLASEPDSSILDLTRGLTAASSLFDKTRRLLPVHAMSVTVREPVWTSSSQLFDLLREIQTIRVLEGSADYWVGMVPGPLDYSGVAYWPGKAMVSQADARTIARMFGHNLSLRVAPCGVENNPNPGYPHAGGISGAWGYRSGGLVPPSTPDLMGYCKGDAISDYHFAKAARWRRSVDAGVGAFAGSSNSPGRALLLWGGIDANGRPFLNPAFVAEARPSPLDRGGAWRIVGEARDGRAFFDRRFEMAETADGDSRMSFALTLPTEPGWADALSRIALTGPDGSTVMNAGTGPTALLLRDPVTGGVRGILRNWHPQGPAGQGDRRADVPEPGLKVQVSAGVPSPDAWHR